MKIFIIVIKILVLAALLIVSNYNLPLADKDAREEFYSLYSVWLEEIFEQGAQITGYVAGVEWLPGVDNSSVSVRER